MAQNEYLDKPELIEYIEYLQYWRRPEYVRFILFPHALYFLNLLREAPFREAIKRGDYLHMVQQQHTWIWQHGRSLRPAAPEVTGQEPSPMVVDS